LEPILEQKVGTIHLVGAQKSNFPWGFENRLIPAFESLGWRVLSTDFRQERNNLPYKLTEKAELVLVCKGEWINPQIISSCPYITSLWYAEQIGDKENNDDDSLHRREELLYNIESFDYVFSHDQGNIALYMELGGKRVAWLPCAAVDPFINKKLNLSKKYDVTFIGSKTPRRKRIISEIENLGVKVFWPDVWNPIEFNKYFNESKIVLNIHLSDLLNTETRIAEVLGSGSFLISEKTSSPDFINDGEHYISFPLGDIDELSKLISYYLDHEKEREQIAYQGYRYIHDKHTFKKRMESFLNSLDFSIARKIWPSYSLGFLFDSKGQITLRMDSFYESVLESYDKINLKNASPESHCLPADNDNSRAVEEKITQDNILKRAFEFADSIVTHTAWSISKKALKLLIEKIGHKITGILEFGSGYSTLFFAKFMDLNHKNIPMYSFEHNLCFLEKLSKELQPMSFVNLLMPKLKQLSDKEYEELFISENPSKIYPHMGRSVSVELYHHTRLHNAFYEIDLNRIKLDKINLIILDGPNGNGRSIAFPLLKDVLNLPAYCLVDDFTHYPFLDEMQKCFDISKIFEFDYGHDAYSLMKITQLK
jgi:spore maturation protein CgeB